MFINRFFLLLAVVPFSFVAAGAPRNVPKTFDHATVTELVRKVEVGTNANILKVAYFVGRRPHPCSRNEGLKLIAKAIACENVGSRRWIILKTLYAFGNFREAAGSANDGFAAYQELFAQELKAYAPDTSRDLNVAMGDFLNVLGLSSAEVWRNAKEISPIILQVAELYVNHMDLSHVELSFDHASRRLAMPAGLEAIVNRALEGEKGGNYIVLTRCAIVLKRWKPHRALGLLLSAEPLLPTKDAAKVQRFYGHMVDLLLRMKRTSEAITAQEKVVRLTGAGRARLMLLRHQNGEKNAIQDEIDSINYTTIDPKEISDMVDFLSRAKQSDATIRVLSGYLEAKREREPGDELWARYRLASLLVFKKRPDDARQVLTVNDLRGPFDTARARIYKARAARLLGQLTSSNKPKVKP